MYNDAITKNEDILYLLAMYAYTNIHTNVCIYV